MSENKDLVISKNIKNNVRTVDLKSKNVNTGNKAYVQTENNGFSNIGNRKDSDNKENTNQLDSKGTYEDTVSTYEEAKTYAAGSNEIIRKDKKTDKDVFKINEKAKEKNKSKNENTVHVDGDDENCDVISKKKKNDVAQKANTFIGSNTKDTSVHADYVKKVTWADVVRR